MHLKSILSWPTIEGFPFENEGIQLNRNHALLDDRLAEQDHHFARREAFQNTAHCVAGEEIDHLHIQSKGPTPGQTVRVVFCAWNASKLADSEMAG